MHEQSQTARDQMYNRNTEILDHSTSGPGRGKEGMVEVKNYMKMEGGIEAVRQELLHIYCKFLSLLAMHGLS